MYLNFGKLKHEENWVVVLLPFKRAVDFHFQEKDEAFIWLTENLKLNSWRVISFRRVAFEDPEMAIMFKLIYF